MKINSKIKEELEDIQVSIEYPPSKDISNIVKLLNSLDISILGKNHDKYMKITLDDIFYFESVDEKVYICTEKKIYESKYKLYELEDILQETSFMRVNKSIILNTNKVETIRSMLNTKFEATLENKEKVIINRTYINKFKVKIGI